jgi:thiamine phosphate synthase YjbQ (UPF0047 family)
MDTKMVRLDMSRQRIGDLTAWVEDFCASRGDGLCSVFAPHATAGVALMELGSGSEADLEAALDRLLPRDNRYRHQHGSSGHGADHLLPVLVSPSRFFRCWRAAPLSAPGSAWCWWTPIRTTPTVTSGSHFWPGSKSRVCQQGGVAWLAGLPGSWYTSLLAPGRVVAVALVDGLAEPVEAEPPAEALKLEPVTISRL